MSIDRGLSSDEIQQIVAGFFGSLVGVSRQSHKNIGGLVIAVLSGTASATYLTPIIADQLKIVDPKYMLGLSFLMGTLGLRGVEFITEKLQLTKTTAKVEKDGNTD
jgi:hypothetical protein